MRISEENRSVAGKVYRVKKEKVGRSKKIYPIPFSQYRKAIKSSRPEVRKELYSEYKERRTQINRQEAKEKLRTTRERFDKFTSKFHSPDISGNRSYKTDNPLKKLLSSGKRTTIKVGGY